MVEETLLLKLHRIINMKYLFLLLLSICLKSELDLTIPEQPAAYIPPEKEFIFNFGGFDLRMRYK